MYFFGRKRNGDRRSSKDRRKSMDGRDKESTIIRRSGPDGPMPLYDRLTAEQKNTVEIITRYFKRQGAQ